MEDILIMNTLQKEKTRGELLAEELQSGKFRKNHRPNHGPNFTGGLEDFYRYTFKKYLSSCGCFLMDSRIIRREYRG